MASDAAMASIAAVLALQLAGPSTSAEIRRRDLSVQDAQKLVVQALDPAQRRLPGLRMDLYKSFNVPGFYKFEVTWVNPNPGSGVVGFFGVNEATGDVWELVLCKKREAKDLDRMQKAIRDKIGISAGELRALTGKAPCQP